MSEYDATGAVEAAARATVDATAAATRSTVAPPFATVEHRARLCHRRHVATVAVAAVIVLAGAAVAVPRAARESVPTDGRRGLKPYEEFLGDNTARRTYVACRDSRATPGPADHKEQWTIDRADTTACFRLAGYEPPSPTTKAYDISAETPQTARCWGTPQPGSGTATIVTNSGSATFPGGETVRSGSWVVAWVGRGGSRCIGWLMEPEHRQYTTDAEKDTGSLGAFRPGLHAEIVTERGTLNGRPRVLVVYGAVPLAAVNVLFTAGGLTYALPVELTSLAGDRQFVGGYPAVPQNAASWTARATDRDGRTIATYSGTL